MPVSTQGANARHVLWEENQDTSADQPKMQEGRIGPLPCGVYLFHLDCLSYFNHISHIPSPAKDIDGDSQQKRGRAETLL